MKTKTRHSKQMSEAWAQCEEFNQLHPVGTKVVYRPVLGSDNGKIETVTRSEAWTLPSAQAVVMVEGKSGGLSLRHIEVL